MRSKHTTIAAIGVVIAIVALGSWVWRSTPNPPPASRGAVATQPPMQRESVSTLRGTVEKLAEKRVLITAKRKDSELSFTATSSAEGVFTFEAVSPGTYELWIGDGPKVTVDAKSGETVDVKGL